MSSENGAAVKERRRPMRVVAVDAICIDCGGTLLHMKSALIKQHAGASPHKCNKCGAVEYIMGQPYPKMEFVPIEETNEPRADTTK